MRIALRVLYLLLAVLPFAIGLVDLWFYFLIGQPVTGIVWSVERKVMAMVAATIVFGVELAHWGVA